MILHETVQLPLVFVPVPVEIALGRRLVALVDEVDGEWTGRYRWRAIRIRHTWYAVRDEGKSLIYMHREIMRAPAELLVDHVSGNGLDNRRANLRLATAAQNRYNARPRQNTSSRCLGVDWNKGARAWRARVWVDGRERLVGYFQSEEEAATARRQAATAVYGEYARRCA